MPVMRAHAALTDREPWSAGEEALPHAAVAIRMRARLLPSIVSWAYDAARTGLPFMRPMCMHDPSDGRLADLDDQWMLGPLLCAPVLTRGAATRQVVLPRGDWHRVTVHDDGQLRVADDAVAGDTTVEVSAGLGDIPMFLAAGTMVFTDPEPMSRRAYNWPPDRLDAIIAPDADGQARGAITVDEGTGLGYRDGRQVVATVELRDGTLQVDVTDGDAALLPAIEQPA